MEERIREVRRRIIEERRSSGFAKFSGVLRGEVLNLIRDSGWSTVKVARRLSLNAGTIQKWHKAPGFLRVTPTTAPMTSGGDGARKSFDVVFPGGARVGGLTLPELRALLAVSE